MECGACLTDSWPRAPGERVTEERFPLLRQAKVPQSCAGQSCRKSSRNSQRKLNGVSWTTLSSTCRLAPATFQFPSVSSLSSMGLSLSPLRSAWRSWTWSRASRCSSGSKCLFWQLWKTWLGLTEMMVSATFRSAGDTKNSSRVTLASRIRLLYRSLLTPAQQATPGRHCSLPTDKATLPWRFEKLLRWCRTSSWPTRVQARAATRRRSSSLTTKSF
mmetsp:Transcript_17630/g.50489  ORF Transcript_17630/g.50489 Transcript_17630/m.50489 type:complete len:217 (-) Transcript_17630:873-1523(-)